MSMNDERIVLQSVFNPNNPGSKITLIGLGSNCFLTLIKGLAGWYLHSASLLAEATHGFSDILADFIILTTIVISKKPQSKRWPFGYGKVESLITLLMAVSMIIASAVVGRHAFTIFLKLFYNNDADVYGDHHRCLNPHAAWFAIAGIALKEYLHLKTKKIAHEQASSVLLAYAIHHRADALTSLVALVSILATSIGFKTIDSVGGVLASIAIIIASIDVVFTSLKELLDVGVCDDTVVQLQDILRDYEHDIQSLRAISSGGQLSIFIRIFIDGNSHSLRDIKGLQDCISSSFSSNRQDVRNVVFEYDFSLEKS